MTIATIIVAIQKMVHLTSGVLIWKVAVMGVERNVRTFGTLGSLDIKVSAVPQVSVEVFAVSSVRFGEFLRCWKHISEGHM